ncbi:MAG: hypothetical protein R2847_03185 [Bacteroidia bacterium]
MKNLFFDSSELKTGYTDYRQQRLDGKNNSGFFALNSLFFRSCRCRKFGYTARLKKITITILRVKNQ